MQIPSTFSRIVSNLTFVLIVMIIERVTSARYHPRKNIGKIHLAERYFLPFARKTTTMTTTSRPWDGYQNSRRDDHFRTRYHVLLFEMNKFFIYCLHTQNIFHNNNEKSVTYIKPLYQGETLTYALSFGSLNSKLPFFSN